jgi:hypothetical protein
VEGERKQTECGSVGAVRDNVPTFIQRKRRYNETEDQSAVPVHPYVKGKVVTMGSGMLECAAEGKDLGRISCLNCCSCVMTEF